MVLDKLRITLEKMKLVEETHHYPSILIVEDDVDQLDLFVDFAASEIRSLLKDKKTTAEQRKKITPFNILRVSEMKSLKQAVISSTNVIMALLDCDIPDVKGAAAHNQFVKKDDQMITGQHRSVDLIAQHLPGTPITLISSMRRFQRLITKYYKDDDRLSLEFIGKDDGTRIQENIRSHLRKYVADE